MPNKCCFTCTNKQVHNNVDGTQATKCLEYGHTITDFRACEKWAVVELLFPLRVNLPEREEKRLK
jgi:hypothetical protein